MNNLPFASVYGVLEKFAISTSFEKLRNECGLLTMPILNTFYTETESYEELGAIQKQEKKSDSNLLFFIKWDENEKCYFPIIMQKKSIYKPIEYNRLFQMANVDSTYIDNMDDYIEIDIPEKPQE